jgi:hypothetical protein
MVKNNVLGNEYSDEWFTGSETVELVNELLKPSGTILCPFDTEQSYFVKKAKALGNCIYGIRDFLSSNYEYDFLMTNPPFSIKTQVIEKVAKSGKPSALVLPLDCLGGVKRHQIYEQYGYPLVYMPTRRISYYSRDWVKQPGSNFFSVILLFNTGKEGLIWESKKRA